MKDTPTLSPSVNELTIRRHMTGDDDAAFNNLFEAVKLTRELARKAGELTSAVLQDGLQTAAHNHKKARDASFSMFEAASKAVDAAIKNAKDEIAAVQSKTRGPAVSRDAINEAKQRELRERLTLLPEDRRRAIVQQAINDNDNLLLGAVLNSPAWLSGFADHDLEMSRAAWARKHFAADLDRAERLEKAIESAMLAGGQALRFINELTDADLIADAETKAKAAKTALAAAK